jgi:hypothetical protein
LPAVGGAQEELAQVLDETLSGMPAPGAVWREKFADPLYPLVSQYPFFSAVVLESKDGADYAVVRSRLFVIDLNERSVSYYFVFLQRGPTWPLEIRTASGASVLLTSSTAPSLTVERVEERIKHAEDLLASGAWRGRSAPRARGSHRQQEGGDVQVAICSEGMHRACPHDKGLSDGKGLFAVLQDAEAAAGYAIEDLVLFRMRVEANLLAGDYVIHVCHNGALDFIKIQC